MTAIAGAASRRRPFSVELPTVACTVVLLAVAFCVVYPLLLVVLESFQVAPPGQPARYGLDGWRAAFAEPLLRAALVNTLKVTVVRQILSLALALLIAWLIARTDLPGRNWIEFAFWRRSSCRPSPSP
jgi:iron(III) transport system permease protein